MGSNPTLTANPPPFVSCFVKQVVVPDPYYEEIVSRERQERLQKWAKELTREQLEKAVVELADFAIDAEGAHFYKGNLSPYWDGNGEPIVPGQKVHEED